jgi:acetyl esterase/lipase
MNRRKTIFMTALMLVCTLSAISPAAAPKQKKGGEAAKPPADLQNVSYGPHERNVLDLWKAQSDKPTPLVVFIHGGGFRAGDKSNLSPILLRLCLEKGISVAAINYRLSQHAPFPAPMLDSARAIQFFRSKAKEWNLDPKRVAATGGSAGAGISLWIGFHDDMADPKSDDPVARQSTRLSCMGVNGAQSSYDPRFIKKIIGGRAAEHPALLPFYGLKADEVDTPRAYKLYEEASAINYVSADDPPVFMFYSDPKGPLPPDAAPGAGIHHPKFGEALKEKLDPLGIECVLRHRDDYKGNPNEQMNREMVEFFLKHFQKP